MCSDLSPGLRRELLDDFYAEVDELLTGARAALVLLEQDIGNAAVIRVQLETLFRALHSVKGNSAIIGLRASEELAHAMEDLLRGLARGEIVFVAPMVDLLLAGTQRLEQIVTAHRFSHPTPPTADLLEQLEKFVAFAADATPPPASPSPPAPLPPLPEDGPEAPEPEALSLTPSHIVRVDLARLDDLMRILGEMVIHRSRLDDRIGQMHGDTAALREVNLGLARSLRQMREAITRVRLVPIAEIFTRMPFVVRDLARNSDKRVRVVLEGHETVVDKYLVERLKEPLLHLVRNAFAHAIEPAAERESIGKPPEGTITLRATGMGESVLIQVRDDGRGIDARAVAARAARLGHPLSDDPDSDSLLDVLCLPGFSTREKADRTSGRGVGMSVVAQTLRELGGRLSLQTTPGIGTEFYLRLPLSLSIVEAIIAKVDGHLCAVPRNAVDEVIQIAAAEVRGVLRTEIIPYRDGLLPFVRLRDVFRIAPDGKPQLTMLVLRGERGVTGLAVDGIHSMREIVVRPMLDPLLRAPGFAGATELGDGQPLLILDPAAITGGVVRSSNN